MTTPGIIWPEAVAPWRVGLVTMRADDEPTVAAADTLYEQLRDAGVETLYDDRDERGGVKLGSMDLIGLPWQVIVGPRGVAAGTVELKRRSTGEREELSIESALARLTCMILNRAERMLARRYLLPGKGEGFIFLVASISLLAVALGVAALIIVMSVMNGFRAELFDKIVGLNGHAVVQGYDGRLGGWQQIADAGEEDAGRHLRGPADRNAADGDRQRPLRRRAGARHAGRGHPRQQDDHGQCPSPATCKSVMPGSGKVAIGSRLAETLGAYPGSQITLWNPEGRSTVMGTVPREVTYTVGAVFEIGVYDYDKAFVLLPMQDAQELLLMGDQVGMVEIQTTNPDKVQDIVAPLRTLGPGPRRDRRLAPDELGPVPGARGRARGDVRRPVADRARRRVQHPLVADHAGPRQDPRHRDPADHGREPARDDEGVRDGRRDHRLARDRARHHPRRDLPVISARMSSNAIQASRARICGTRRSAS